METAQWGSDPGSGLGSADSRLAGDAGLKRLATLTCRRILRLFNVSGAAILLGGHSGLRMLAQAGDLSADPLAPDSVRRLVDRAMREGRPGRTDDLASDTLPVIVTPFRPDNAPHGLIVMQRAPHHQFTDAEVTQSTLLAESLGVTLQLHQAGEQLRQSEAQYRLLFQRNPFPMYVSTFEDRRIVAANPAVLALYGYTEAAFVSLTAGDLLWEQAPAARSQLLAQTAARRRIQGLLRRHRTSDGRPLDVEIWTDEIEFGGQVARLVLIYDVTARLQAERELARVSRAQQMLSDCNEALVRSSDEASLYARVCNIATVTGGYRRALVALALDDARRSIRVADWPGQPDDGLSRVRLSWDAQRPDGQALAAQVIRSGQPRVVDDVENHRHELFAPDRLIEMGYTQMVCLPLRDGEHTFGVLHLMGDAALGAISSSELALLMQLANNFAHGIGRLRAREQRRRDALRIAQLAYSDALTGLPNRTRLLEQLQSRLAETRAAGRWSSLMLMDIHNFKSLNEVWGHDEGDRLLKSFSQRLQLQAPGVCARLGADEFVALLGPHEGTEAYAMREAESRAHSLLQGLAHTHHSDGWMFECHSSAGLVLFNGQDGGPSELLQRAEIALYAAKAHGPQSVRRYDRELHAAVVERAQLEQALREALQLRQFELYFQPQCHAGGEWLGAEALVRWRHPQRGWISPGAFVPACEETGLILPLGEQVLEMACATLAAWRYQPRLSELYLAVNVSARQFRQPDFVRQVARILDSTGAPAHRLKLELTESVMVDDVARVIEKMKALGDMGVRFSLDDFGTGYSSLGQLKRLPLHQIKIDQSFVRDLLTDPNDASIVQAVIQLGASLGLQVIAEGVETVAQRDALARFGCPAYQGYLIGKPMPRQEVEPWLTGSRLPV